MKFIANMMRGRADPRIRRSGRSSLSGSDRLTRGLGWFSIALGVAELVAVERIAAVGMPSKKAVLRGYGVREICSGILCLSVDKKAGLMSRIAGDGLDVATLSRGLHRLNPKRGNVVLAISVVSGEFR
ncbi:hypothetical protein [Bosea sp. BK604]|uniref:hypothetical protein n=1 Tax=Bosea sp. BK604 TaxID=2512180 RepID=UPI0010479128|nr:hypothetical protein [Bosea sp. BK604]TCR68267.1 hypothetical protein EV560_10294 [Bosea sp. BK604]